MRILVVERNLVLPRHIHICSDKYSNTQPQITTHELVLRTPKVLVVLAVVGAGAGAAGSHKWLEKGDEGEARG